MKILVTGGAGFIGSNLAIELEKKCNEVIIIDNLSSGNKENLKGFKGEIIKADISKPLKLKKDFDIIFHLASITDTTFRDDTEMYKQNIIGFMEMLRLAMENNSKFIYASSAGVYGNGPVPMKESQRLGPLNAYAHSKKIMDDIAEKFFDNIHIVGLRYFNVFGPKEAYKGKSASMIYQLCRKMRQGIKPRIFIDGGQKRDHIYVKDVVNAAILAVNAKKSGIYNVGTGIATTFNELVSILNDVLNTHLETEYFENKIEKVYQNNTQADTKNAEKYLGFRSGYKLKDAIKEYVDEIK